MVCTFYEEDIQEYVHSYSLIFLMVGFGDQCEVGDTFILEEFIYKIISNSNASIHLIWYFQKCIESLKVDIYWGLFYFSGF